VQVAQASDALTSALGQDCQGRRCDQPLARRWAVRGRGWSGL